MWLLRLPQAANVRPSGDGWREKGSVLCSACPAWYGQRLQEAVCRGWVSQSSVLRYEGRQKFMLLSRPRHGGNGESSSLHTSLLFFHIFSGRVSTSVLPDFRFDRGLSVLILRDRYHRTKSRVLCSMTHRSDRWR